MKPVVTWVLVADAAHARTFVNKGPGSGLTELPEEARQIDLAPSRDINADRPGRVQDSAGPGRHSMEPPTDAKEHAKQVFLKEIAAALKEGHDRNAFDRLVLVAPPAALGALRAALAPGLRKILHAELAKDLVQVKAHDLPSRIGEVLAV